MGALLVIGLLAFGIYYVVQMLSNTESETVDSVEGSHSKTESIPTSESRKSDVSHTENKVPNIPTQKQYTEVYVFCPNEAVARCAHCDGENPMGTRICHICGYETDI